MSLSNPKQENPVTKWIEYSGETGKFFFYDKEKKEKVSLPLPLKFIVLEELNTISGFSESLSSGIYSNEVLDLSKENLHVKSFKGGYSANGLYSQIKDNIIVNGGKFTKSVYAVIVRPDNSLTEIVNFKFKGASLQGWFDKSVNVYKSAVIVNSFVSAKKGKTVYQIPVFESSPFTEIQFKLACEQERTLQEYLKQYRLNQSLKEIPANEIDEVEAEHMNNEKVKTAINEMNQEIISENQNEDLPF